MTPDYHNDLTLTNTHIFFAPPYDGPTNNKCKHLGMMWSNVKQRWSLKKNLQNLMAFMSTFFPDRLSEYLPAVPTMPTIPNCMMPHQARDMQIAHRTPRWLFANDTGTGKTFEAIEMGKAKNLKTLVICILSNIEETWVKEYNKWAPELSKVNLWAWRNRKAFEQQIEHNDVCIINFESFKSKARTLAKYDWGTVIIDESSKLKSPTAQTTKMVEKFCVNIPFVYLFSGSPAPNGEHEYFSQARLVDKSIFGASMYRFRNKYFYQDGHTRKWILNPGMRDKFLQKLATLSSSVAFEDVVDDLPETPDDRLVPVTLSPKELKAYADMYKEAIIEIEDKDVSAVNAVSKIMKLRQLTSGFVYSRDEEDKHNIATDFGRAKLKALLQLLEHIGNKQVIIWAQFHHDALYIQQALGGNVPMVNGLVKKQVDRDANINAFKEGKAQYIIAHPKSMGHGHNLFMSHYMVFFSFSYSHEEHKQARARIYRKGQTRACNYFYMYVPGTVDRIIYRALTDKANVERLVLDYIRGKEAILPPF